MTDHADVDDVIAAVRRVEADRADSLHRSGRLLADLHDLYGLSWPEIARRTGVAQTTAYRRAEPFLRLDPGAEQS